MSEDVKKPVKLYKYRSLAPLDRRNTSRIITRHEVYFASRSQFNDPFDCKFITVWEGSENEKTAFAAELAAKWYPNASEEKLQAVTLKFVSEFSGPDRTDHALADQSQLVQEGTRRIGIFSLSEVNNDILMWSHYADSHRGICLEFSEMDVGDYHKVDYVNSVPRFNPLSEFRRDDGTDSPVEQVVLSKWEHWSYEKEWRILSFDRDRPDATGPGVYGYKPQQLTGVILGSQISDDDRDDVLRWCRDQSHDIAISQAREKTDAFGLDIVPYDPQ